MRRREVATPGPPRWIASHCFFGPSRLAFLVQYPRHHPPHEGEVIVNKTLAITLATLGATGAIAQTPPATPPPGRLLASNCFQCHGTDGKTEDTFAKLAGKSSSEIFNELREMRVENKRGEIMTIHALGYTEAQLRAIADYFARQR